MKTSAISVYTIKQIVALSKLESFHEAWGWVTKSLVKGKFRIINWLAVYTTNETESFWKRSFFESWFSERPGSDNELDRRRVNERRARIETDAVTNETASV